MEGKKPGWTPAPSLVPLSHAQPAVCRQQQVQAGTGHGPLNVVAEDMTQRCLGSFISSGSPEICGVIRVGEEQRENQAQRCAGGGTLSTHM